MIQTKQTTTATSTPSHSNGSGVVTEPAQPQASLSAESFE